VHPVDGEVMRLRIRFVEDENEWQACLVEDTIGNRSARNRGTR
jgi:hypothetical protein